MIPQNVPSGFSLHSLVKKSANRPRRLGSRMGEGVSVVSLIIRFLGRRQRAEVNLGFAVQKNSPGSRKGVKEECSLSIPPFCPGRYAGAGVPLLPAASGKPIRGQSKPRPQGADSLFIPDPWVKIRINQVDKQIDPYNHGGENQVYSGDENVLCLVEI